MECCAFDAVAESECAVPVRACSKSGRVMLVMLMSSRTPGGGSAAFEPECDVACIVCVPGRDDVV